MSLPGFTATVCHYDRYINFNTSGRDSKGSNIYPAQVRIPRRWIRLGPENCKHLCLMKYVQIMRERCNIRDMDPALGGGGPGGQDPTGSDCADKARWWSDQCEKRCDEG